MLCPQCHAQVAHGSRFCTQCGGNFAVQRPTAAPSAIGDDAGMRLLLPVGRSLWAIAAGYLGLISVLVIPAPFALVFGLLALRDIRRHPERHGMGRAIFGIVMGSLVLLAVVGFFFVGAFGAASHS